MDAEVEKQVIKVRKFGRAARALCILVAVLFATVAFGALASITRGTAATNFTVDLGSYAIATDHITTPAAKAWTIAVIVTVFGFLFAGLLQLYRLFGNLAQGHIYTQDTVYRIRQIGLIALAGAVLQILLPLSSELLLQAGVFDASMIAQNPARHGGLIFGSAQMPGLFTAGLILLASWIMDVGRKTAEEAEGLRRDAELVV